MSFLFSVPGAVVLLLVGIAIYFFELFIPSAGMLFIVGTTCLVFAVVVAFLQSPTTGIAFLVVDAVLAVILPPLFLKIWRHSPIGKRMFLDRPETASTTGGAPDGILAPADADTLKGLIGQTITPLRPAGTVEIAGRRIDTVAEGGAMIEVGEMVKVVEVQGNRIVVRKLWPEELAPPQKPNVSLLDQEFNDWSIPGDKP